MVEHYKSFLSYSEDFKVLSFLGRGRKHNLKSFPINGKYNNGLIPIYTAKKRGLCSLLCLVPPVFHEFYKNLPTSANIINIEPDLRDEGEDEVD